MKHLLLTTISAVVLVGCGESQSPEPPTAKAPDISIHEAAASEAAIDGNIEAVKQHIAAGTDVNAVDDKGWSVLDNALASKNEELINFVKTTGGNSNADKSIFIASGVGALEAVKQYITAGTDVNTKDKHGRTPLLMAAWWDHKEIAKLLIGAGADVNAIADGDVTPLDLSIKLNLTEINDLLRKHGGKTGEELKAEGE